MHSGLSLPGFRIALGASGMTWLLPRIDDVLTVDAIAAIFGSRQLHWRDPIRQLINLSQNEIALLDNHLSLWWEGFPFTTLIVKDFESYKLTESKDGKRPTIICPFQRMATNAMGV